MGRKRMEKKFWVDDGGGKDENPGTGICSLDRGG